MKKMKVLAFLLALSLMLTAVGCAGDSNAVGTSDVSSSQAEEQPVETNAQDTAAALTAGKDSISAGVYIIDIMTGINEAGSKAVAVNPLISSLDDVLATDLDGISGSDYIKEFASAAAARQLAIHKKFVELGLTLSDSDVSTYESYARSIYAQSGDLYRATGVSEQAVMDYNRLSLESYKLFQHLYSDGGEYGATIEEKRATFDENYNLAEMLVFYKIDTTTYEPLEESIVGEVQTLAESYYQRALSGENMADLLFEKASSELAEGEELPERGSDEEYYMVVDKVDNGYYYPTVLIDHLNQAEDNSIAKIEDDHYIIVVKKLSSAQASDELISNYYEQMLPTVKAEEYNDLADSWSKELSISYSADVLNTFTPEKVVADTNAYDEALAAENAAAAESAASESAASESAASDSEASSEEAASSESTAE